MNTGVAIFLHNAKPQVRTHLTGVTFKNARL